MEKKILTSSALVIALLMGCSFLTVDAATWSEVARFTVTAGEEVTGTFTCEHVEWRIRWEFQYPNFTIKIFQKDAASSIAAKIAPNLGTFPKEIAAFTYEGFRNFTSREYLIDVQHHKKVTNPIYSEYLDLNRTGQVNMTWTEYWENWINSIAADLLWEYIRDCVKPRWLEFETAFSNASETVKIGNEICVNILYRLWVENRTFRRTGYTWQVLPWNEIVYILNMTDSPELANYTSIDLSDIYGEKYRLDISNATDENPAYRRWKQLWNGTLPWEIYWQFWEEIQVYYGREAFINMCLKTIRIGYRVQDSVYIHDRQGTFQIVAYGGGNGTIIIEQDLESVPEYSITPTLLILIVISIIAATLTKRKTKIKH